MSLVDPTGLMLTTIRDNAAVAALTTRVRGARPMPKEYNAAGVLTDPGDARGPGKYVRFVVLVRLGAQRLRHAPVQEVRLAARCYGLNEQDAAVLAGTVSDAIHNGGHRTSASGVVVFGSYDDGGDGAAKDPDTSQPYETVVIQVGALTSLLP
jgi:hypothetical protein